MAIQSDEKDDYIALILNLDEETQTDLMKIIQKNMANGSQNNSSMGDNDDSNSFIDDAMSVDNMSTITLGFEAQMQIDKLKKQNTSLRMKLADTEEENSKLKANNEKLSFEVKELSDDLEIEKKSKRTSADNSKAIDAMNKLESAERELEQLKYDYNAQKKKNQLFESKISDLRTSTHEEKDQLNDELEELRSKLRRLEQVEAVNALYKKKLEETADVKNKLREIEEHNRSLISQMEGKITNFNHLIDNEREFKSSQDYKVLMKNLQKELDEEREKSMKINLENSDYKATLSDKLGDIERLEKNIESKDARIRKLLVEKESVGTLAYHINIECIQPNSKS